ncbi:MAG: hypothetical protein K2M16_03910, partial [Muribaculaceae bacterium]|nr:hypothetical protein [Muribaculaceae bacterium]
MILPATERRLPASACRHKVNKKDRAPTLPGRCAVYFIPVPPSRYATLYYLSFRHIKIAIAARPAATNPIITYSTIYYTPYFILRPAPN